jgi:hypothetical protein
MAWHMTGQMLEACSCKMLCPCALGPAEPDQGWCAGALVFDIQSGQADGVSLDRSTVVLVVNMPGDFLGGNGTARLYVDEAASAAQRQELEALFMGQRGGPLGAVAALFTHWLPTQTVRITRQEGTNPSLSIGSVGQLTWQRLTTQDGRQTTLQNAPVLGVIGIESSALAGSAGSQWSDPEMRQWQSGGNGTISAFTMSA